MFAASEGEVQAQLQEPRTPNRVLNDSQAARRRDRSRTHEVGKEFHVVVRRIEIRMVEHIKRVRFKTQLEAFLDGELLGQTHVEADLERTSEQVPAGSAVEGLELIATGGSAGRHTVRARREKLRCKIGCIEHRRARIDAERALQFRLPGCY